ETRYARRHARPEIRAAGRATRAAGPDSPCARAALIPTAQDDYAARARIRTFRAPTRQRRRALRKRPAHSRARRASARSSGRFLMKHLLHRQLPLVIGALSAVVLALSAA